VTDNYYDNLGTVTYWWSHAMISDQTYKQLISTCDFHHQKESDECESLYSYAMDQEFGNIDQYNIYAPPCNHSDGSSSGTGHSIRLPHLPHLVYLLCLCYVFCLHCPSKNRFYLPFSSTSYYHVPFSVN
jgi:serine carboxypeptidase-like clade 2